MNYFFKEFKSRVREKKFYFFFLGVDGAGVMNCLTMNPNLKLKKNICLGERRGGGLE